ncbi:phytoene desaturase family protein [Thermodesulfobacterium hveragerdense]|uniref:phytoene desaturase family protein n=1 Tax=Thermodesulfobacterium hveragerdense TaxID=53424 RepID=UPI00042A3344|nr:FAD-dependent oxidoreductase [Thermodesulfobacterium hveragerdense]
MERNPINKDGALLIIGGGIGGILGAQLFKSLRHEVILLEAGNRLGGCASTFNRNGTIYNAGATTIAGLFPDYPLDRLFYILGIKSRVTPLFKFLDPTIEVDLGNDISLAVYSDPDRTIESFNRFCKHKGHKPFFKHVYAITQELLTSPIFIPEAYTSYEWLIKGVAYFLKNSPSRILKYLTLSKTKGLKLIKTFYPNLPKKLFEVLQGLNFIVSQTSLEKTSALALTLALGYNFTGVCKVEGGFGKLWDCIDEEIEIKYNCEVIKIKQTSGGYLIYTNQEVLHTDRLVLAIPFLEKLSLFQEDIHLFDYFKRFRNGISDLSAFVLYGKIKRDKLSGYKTNPKILVLSEDKRLLNSGYLYLSFLEQKGDYLTFTISTHTPLKLWMELSDSDLKFVRKKLEALIIQTFLERTGLRREDLEEYFSATPFTYFKYVRRFCLGGFQLTTKTSVWNIPNNITPFSGLYLLGDHAFAGQGFLGVALGCLNLYNHIHQKTKKILV